eukprot:2014701-Rhodomonas_salina.1
MGVEQRGSGKTQFLRRLQNLEYDSKYVATPEITTAHMIWTHKGPCSRPHFRKLCTHTSRSVSGTEEHVKVELWDVVDKGIQPKAEWAGVTGKGGVEEKENAQEANVSLTLFPLSTPTRRQTPKRLTAESVHVGRSVGRGHDQRLSGLRRRDGAVRPLEARVVHVRQQARQGDQGRASCAPPRQLRRQGASSSPFSRSTRLRSHVCVLTRGVLLLPQADLIPPLPPSVTDKEVSSPSSPSSPSSLSPVSYTHLTLPTICSV